MQFLLQLSAVERNDAAFEYQYIYNHE